jgi:hypothetical protein
VQADIDSKVLRRKKIVVILAIFVVFGWLFSIDRHQAITYSPTDGLAMMQDYAKKAENEGVIWSAVHGGIVTPGEFVTYGVYSKGRPIPLVIQKIRFTKGTLPLLRFAIRIVGKYPENPRLSLRAIGVDDSMKYSKYLNLNDGRSGFSSFESEEEFADMRILRETIENLPPNTYLRSGSNFYAVQLGKEVRVYSENEFPEELLAARQALDSMNTPEP